MCALGSRSGRSLLTLLALLLSTLSGARAPLNGLVEHGHETRSVIKPAEEGTIQAQVQVVAVVEGGIAGPRPARNTAVATASPVVALAASGLRRGSAGGPRAP